MFVTNKKKKQATVKKKKKKFCWKHKSEDISNIPIFF